VVNHLKSKGSACDDVGDPDLNDGQGNCNLTRTKAAQALGDWLATDPTGSGDADFSIIGNLNAYQMEDPITALKDAGYTDLLAVHAIDLAYSYVFDGQFGYLDHALASRTMALQVTSVALWSINADEPRALDYNDYNQPGLYSPDVYRSSDHDPVLVGLELRDVPPMPSDPVPPHGATGVPIDQRLSWRGVTSYDPVTYTVAFGTSTPPPIVGITHRPQYTPTLVEYTDYYWSVTVSDGLGTTAGPIWTFSTAGFEYLYLPLVLNDSR
jgi:hypothetical protein